MDIQISQMHLDDYEAIAPILISEFDAFWKPEVLKEELLQENSYYLVAKKQDMIVGFIGIKIALDSADLMNIVVRKDFREQGIASFLLLAMFEYCKKKNIREIILEVNENNHAAIALYESHNFKKIHIRKQYYKDNHAIIMKKNI